MGHNPKGAKFSLASVTSGSADTRESFIVVVLWPMLLANCVTGGLSPLSTSYSFVIMRERLSLLPHSVTSQGKKIFRALSSGGVTWSRRGKVRRFLFFNYLAICVGRYENKGTTHCLGATKLTLLKQRVWPLDCRRSCLCNDGLQWLRSQRMPMTTGNHPPWAG
ncbi:hypothetical protein Tsubulata_035702 [Turnera subulata]|uniref:Uncharacterized protein n=1 Tax=Turnera subulata TaxID=218843 RepID=A0A9Q0FDS9_9ROSI|nr:hypothetical protein Tsubulata_035702 [Turnera subulata]